MYNPTFAPESDNMIERSVSGWIVRFNDGSFVAVKSLTEAYAAFWGRNV